MGTTNGPTIEHSLPVQSKLVTVGCMHLTLTDQGLLCGPKLMPAQILCCTCIGSTLFMDNILLKPGCQAQQIILVSQSEVQLLTSL
jgi:hypothetical protein